MAAAPDYFALYDISRTLSPDADAVRAKYYALSRQHHPDRAAGDTAAQAEALRMSAQVNEGYCILGKSDVLMGYVLKLHSVLEEEEQYKLPPGFLMEIMELNEAVGNADMAPDMRPDAYREFTAVMNAWEQSVAPLAARYNAGERGPEILAALKDFYFRKKYLLRIKHRLDGH